METMQQCLIFCNQGGLKGVSQEKRGRIWKCKIWEVGGLAPPLPCPFAGITEMLHAEDLFTYSLFSQLRIVFHFQLPKKTNKQTKKIDKIFFI